MPFYSFYCPSCGQQSEAFLTMADRDSPDLAPVCPPGKQHRGQYRMVRAIGVTHGHVVNPAVPRTRLRR
jgi:putative FmdB family regulatory protein